MTGTALPSAFIIVVVGDAPVRLPSVFVSPLLDADAGAEGALALAAFTAAAAFASFEAAPLPFPWPSALSALPLPLPLPLPPAPFLPFARVPRAERAEPPTSFIDMELLRRHPARAHGECDTPARRPLQNSQFRGDQAKRNDAARRIILTRLLPLSRAGTRRSTARGSGADSDAGRRGATWRGSAAWRRHGGGMARAHVSASRAQARGIPETVLHGGA